MTTLVSQTKSFFKFIAGNFFIWGMPFCTILLNLFKHRDIIGINVLIALCIGLIINISWDIAMLHIQKKEYHKNLL